MFDSSSVVPELPSASNGHPPKITKHDDAADSASADGAPAHVDDALSASPRTVTTGGNPFPPVIPQQPSAALAHIDWFAFTITPPDGRGLPWLFPHLVALFGICEATPTGKGWNGYTERHDLGSYGLLAQGGKSQRSSIHVELNATGCARVLDWLKVMESIWGQLRN
jgi:hypothetical protein